MDLILVGLSSALVSGSLTFLACLPFLKQRKQKDIDTEEFNKQIREECEDLEEKVKELMDKKSELILERSHLITRITELNDTLTVAEKASQEAADMFYKAKMEIAQEHLAEALLKEGQKFQENAESFKVQYEETVQELMSEYKNLEANFKTLKDINDAAIAASKRAEEMKTTQDFYRIQLSKTDEREIESLREVESQLREKEPLNKIIWKCYYEKPTSDLIGRVIGSGVHSGIYKITDVASGKCYVGQSVNLADRWRQHIKRGLGAETPTKNKLYPAMKEIGPQNFTFEVVEECDRSLLDSREDFWQEYFKSKEFGFSIK